MSERLKWRRKRGGGEGRGERIFSTRAHAILLYLKTKEKKRKGKDESPL